MRESFKRILGWFKPSPRPERVWNPEASLFEFYMHLRQVERQKKQEKQFIAWLERTKEWWE